MCKNCDVVEKSFIGAQSNSHMNLEPLHSMLSVFVRRGQLKVYAGDCRFEDMLDVLGEEMHYTVCFYLECSECGRIYFFGACIRGTPIYKLISDITNEKIDNMVWGKFGDYFR